MSGPESWKTKCSIRRVDDVAMTDNGTLILRRDSLPPMRALSETSPYHHAPSIAPFAIDLVDEEDHLPPARNSDVLGLRLPTMEVDGGRSVSRASFLAGLSAGFTAVAIAGAIAFVSFTNDYASHGMPRTPNAVTRGNGSLTVAEPEMAVLKAPPAKKRLKRVKVVTEESPAEVPAETPESD